MKKYQVIGFIDNPKKKSGFMTVIYKREEELYFHQISSDRKRITGFLPYQSVNFKTDKNFQSLVGPWKGEGEAAFFVFKKDTMVMSGTREDETFVKFLRSVEPQIKDSHLLADINMALN